MPPIASVDEFFLSRWLRQFLSFLRTHIIWGFLAIVVMAAVFYLLFYFVNPTPQVSLLTVDGQSAIALAPDAPADLMNGGPGFEVLITGTTAHWEGSVYLIVKPMQDPNWYVQPITVPVGAASKDGMNWAGHAFLGTQNAGVNELFSVYALASRAKYEANQKLPEQPEGIRSNAVLLRRNK
jgi:hypothetical protein